MAVARKQQDLGGTITAIKSACRLATVSNDTLVGLAARDGFVPLAGDRILVKNQITGADNGIYIAAAGAWTRATDMDVSAEVLAGVLVFVNDGTANKDSLWALGTNDPILVGTTSLAFVLVASSSGVGAVLPQPTIAALQALDVTNLLDGQTIWVNTLRRFFQLRATAVTQDLQNYSKVNSTAAGRQWWDLGYSNITWLASASTGVPWLVNNTATNEGDGITTPVRTFSELNRRLHGLFYTTGDIIDVEVAGDLDADDPIDVQWGHADAGQAGRTRVYGATSIAASGTITGVQNFDDTGNLEQTITTSIDIDAHFLKQLRIKTSGGAFKATTFTDEIITPGSEYGLKNPANNDNTPIETYPTANVALVVGDTFDVINFPTAPDARIDTPNHQYPVLVENIHVIGVAGFASMATDENAGLTIMNSRLTAQTYSHKVQMILQNSTIDTPAEPFSGSFGMAAGGVNATPGVPAFTMRERGGTFLGFAFNPKFNRCAPRLIDMDVEVSSGAFCVFRAPLGTPVLSLGPSSTGTWDSIWGDFNLDRGVVFFGAGNKIKFSSAPLVTVALAQLRFAVDGVDANFTDLNFTNINDKQGNEVSGTAGVVATDFIRLKCKDAGGWGIGKVVRGNGTHAEAVLAKADTAANATGILGAAATTTVFDAFGLVAALGQPSVINHTATPVAQAVAYLSAATAGLATNTVPAASGTNQKVRLGNVYDKVALGPWGYVVTANQVVPRLSDGIDPSTDIVGAPSLDVNDEVQHAVIGMTEEVAAEFAADFTLMQPALIRARLTALTSQTGGATGTYRVRVGGTPGAADGVAVATLASTNGAYPSTPDGVTGGSFANPGARALVKITAVASLAGQEARVKGAQIVFVTA